MVVRAAVSVRSRVGGNTAVAVSDGNRSFAAFFDENAYWLADLEARGHVGARYDYMSLSHIDEAVLDLVSGVTNLDTAGFPIPGALGAYVAPDGTIRLSLVEAFTSVYGARYMLVVRFAARTRLAASPVMPNVVDTALALVRVAEQLVRSGVPAQALFFVSQLVPRVTRRVIGYFDPQALSNPDTVSRAGLVVRVGGEDGSSSVYNVPSVPNLENFVRLLQMNGPVGTVAVALVFPISVAVVGGEMSLVVNRVVLNIPITLNLYAGRKWVAFVEPPELSLGGYGFASIDQLRRFLREEISTESATTFVRVLHDVQCRETNCFLSNVGRSDNPVFVWSWPQNGPAELANAIARSYPLIWVNNNEYHYAVVTGRGIRAGRAYAPLLNTIELTRDSVIVSLAAFAGNRIRITCSRIPENTARVVLGSQLGVEYAFDEYGNVVVHRPSLDRRCLYDFVAARLSSIDRYEPGLDYRLVMAGFDDGIPGFAVVIDRRFHELLGRFMDDMLYHLARTIIVNVVRRELGHYRSVLGEFEVQPMAHGSNVFIVRPATMAETVARALSLRCYRDTTPIGPYVSLVDEYRCYQPYQQRRSNRPETFSTIRVDFNGNVVGQRFNLTRIFRVSTLGLYRLVQSLRQMGYTVLEERMGGLGVRLVVYRTERYIGDSAVVEVPAFTN